MLSSDKQRGAELDYWLINEIPNGYVNYEKWYKQTYIDIDSFIADMGMNNTVLDFGCGAYSYICRYKFNKIVLVDSLINEYTKTLNNLQPGEKHLKIDALPNKSVDVTFALNCLDHMDNQLVMDSVRHIMRVTKNNIVIFVDLREKEDQHHYVFNTQLLDIISTQFNLDTLIKYTRGGDIFGHIYFFGPKREGKETIYKERTYGKTMTPYEVVCIWCGKKFKTVSSKKCPECKRWRKVFDSTANNYQEVHGIITTSELKECEPNGIKTHMEVQK